MEASDQELIRRARDGDRLAFGQLVERHARSLFGVAVMMMGAGADAQDVVQETLLGAFQGLARYRGDASVRTWLMSILTRQVALHRRREHHRRMPSLDASDQEASRLAHATVAPATAASDARLDLAELLQRLTPEHRDVLVLREIEQLSYDQIAVALSLPRGTVESRLFRARQAMRDLAASLEPRSARTPSTGSGQPGGTP